MKIFAIRDESAQEQKDLAYLLYYEQEKRFYIELPENADAWETPLHESDRPVLLEGLDGVLSQTLQDKIWEMIWKRWCAYEDFCNSR